MDKINIKKNFFFTANSEHYQDAILKWIFYNHTNEENKSEVEEFSLYFILKLLNYNGEIVDSDEITNVEVNKQKHDSDVDVIVSTKTKGEHLILIEDKTVSSIHSSNKNKDEEYKTQLVKYYDKFKNDKKYNNLFLSGKVHLFYYKNDYLSEDEEDKIKKSNKICEKYFCDLIEVYVKDKIDKKISDKEKYIEGLKRSSSIENNKLIIAELKEKKEKALSVKSIQANYTWNVINIECIDKIFRGFSESSFTDDILKQYHESIIYKKKWLDSKSYPLNIPEFKGLSQYYQKIVWFSYMKNWLYKELKEYVDKNGGKINEVYWHQGGEDINIGVFVKNGDLTHLRITTKHIKNIEKIVIQVAIYGAEKNYYKKNKGQIDQIKKCLQDLYNENPSENLLKRDDRIPTNGEEKTIASTDAICISNKNIDEELIEIIKKCFVQLGKVDEVVRKKLDI